MWETICILVGCFILARAFDRGIRDSVRKALQERDEADEAALAEYLDDDDDDEEEEDDAPNVIPMAVPHNRSEPEPEPQIRIHPDIRSDSLPEVGATYIEGIRIAPDTEPYETQ